jgi:dephospho-CoA kinase
MKLFGLTGGIGAGKSTAAAILRRLGVPVVDTDELAHQLVEPGRPALREIAEAFGAGFIGPDGRLKRAELGRLVFSDAAARQRLEAILHPRIRAAWQAEVARWRQAGQPLGVVVIPLLYETDARPLFDAVICVACSAATQRERLRARGWSEADIEQRLAAQWPLEKKIAAADYLVWTEAGLDVHEAQLRRILLLEARG